MRGPRDKGAATKKKRARRAAEAPRRLTHIKVADIDYKDVAFLQRMVSAQGKCFSRKRTGLTADCQRELSRALKRARFMALMPYVT